MAFFIVCEKHNLAICSDTMMGGDRNGAKHAVESLGGDNKPASCYTLDANWGFSMTKIAAVSVATQVRRLAKSHKVTAERDGMSRMAVAITRMAGDAVELDNVEQLLVNLKRKGVLSKSEILTLQGGCLQEKRDSKKKISI